MSSESKNRQRFIAFIFANIIQYPRTLKSNIYYSNKREPPTFFLSDTNTWSRFGPFCWQNKTTFFCSVCNSGIDLVFVLDSESQDSEEAL